MMSFPFKGNSFNLKIIPVLILLWLPQYLSAQKIDLFKFDDLKSRISVSNDTLYILNFWATWCKPCIQELPYFEKCNSEYQKKAVKIILVNLDFNSQVKSVAEPFIRKKNIHSSVAHITETNYDLWINKVDSNWSGAIPATSMYKNGKKVFFKEGSMTEEELKNVIDFKMMK